MIEPLRIIQTQDLPYAFIHLTIPRSEMQTILPPTLTELFAAVKAQGLPIVPWFAHHLTLSEGDFDFEACIPVAESFTPAGRIQRGLWPAGRSPAPSTMATTPASPPHGKSSTPGSDSKATPTPPTSTSTTSSTKAPPKTPPTTAPN